MPTYVHPDICDNGLNLITAIAAGGNLRLIVFAGQPGNVVEARALYDGTAGKSRLTPEIAISSSDITHQSSSGGGRELVFASKTSAWAATRPAGDLRYGLVDVTPGLERLLWVEQETSDQAATAANPVTIPSFKIILEP
jgi:hypothetical protein